MGEATLGVRPTTGARLEGIEGLRAVAAGSVLVYHAWIFSAPSGGWASAGPLTRLLPDLSFGVVLFFTLSGFLLYRPFVAGLLGYRDRPSVRAYFRNRLLRIAPAYVVILLLCALVLREVLIRGADDSLRSGGVDGAGHLSAMVLLVQHYHPSTVVTGIGPAWSLAIEVVFYAILPLLALGAAGLRWGNGRAARLLVTLAPAVLLLCVGLAGKWIAASVVPPVSPYAGWNADWHSVIERGFLCHADLFAFGMALAVVRVETEHGALHLGRFVRPALLALALGGYVAVAWATAVDDHLSYSLWNTVMAASLAGLLGLVVLPSRSGQRPVITRVLEARPLVVVGIISYSVFLWHEPVTHWLRDSGWTRDGTAGFVANTLLVAAVTLALSALTYRYVERPALRRKHAHRPTTELPREQVQAAP